jgi:hypothetical protein
MGEKMSDAEWDAAGDGFWAEARRRYEDKAQKLEATAQALGLTTHQLVREAKLRGWRLRGRAKAQDTRQTLARFKELLQRRLGELEAEIRAMSDDAKSKRDISDINLLVRTLEKVLQLERRERDTRIKRRSQRIRCDDAERAELARRIASLRRQPPGGAGGGGDEARTADGAADGLAGVDEDKPAPAGGS